MKKSSPIISALFLGLGIVLAFVIPTIYKFKHIDATETRVFVENWYFIVAGILCLIISRIFHDG